MDYRSLVNKLEAIQAGTYIKEAIANPYKDPAQAAIFNAMSDADQEWLTRGGGVPDITDKYILMRAPNKGQPDPAKAAAAQAASTATVSSDAFIKEKLAKLKELTAKLETGLAGGQAGKPAAMPAQATSIEQAKALGAANPQMAQPTTTDQPGSLKVYKEGTMSKELVESFGYETTDEGVGSALMKAGGRALPGVGLAFGAKDAYDRVKAGDYTGAAIAGAGGVAGLIPGLGTAAQLGLMGVQAGRDKSRTGSWMPDDTEIAAAAKGQAPATTQAAKPAGNLGIKQMQKELGVAPDGAIGPNTKAAMAKNPTLAAKYGFGPDGSVLPKAASVAESMSNLRDRLAMIESSEQVDEVSLKGAWDAAKGIGSALKFGAQNSGVKGIAGAGVNAAERGAIRTGQVAANVAKNKGVQATAKGAGLAGAGAAAGYALAGKPGGAPQAGKPTNPQAGKPTAAAPTAPVIDPELIKQIQATMGELADIETPEVMAELSRTRDVLTKAGVAE